MTASTLVSWGGQIIGMSIFVIVIAFFAWTVWKGWKDNHRGGD